MERVKKAMGAMIIAARRLKHRGMTEEVGREYGEIIGREAALAGMTLDEGLHYGERIWLVVQQEHQA